MTSPRSALVLREADLARGDAASVAVAVGAYLRQTEQEKADHGLTDPIDPDADLPEQYRREVADPAGAYAGCRGFVAQITDIAETPETPEIADEIVGVMVLASRDDVIEVKRLWAAPAVRGRGIGSALLNAAVRAAPGGLRLSVWDWRLGAIRLYESLGFVRVASWDARERLVCMERIASR